MEQIEFSEAGDATAKGFYLELAELPKAESFGADEPRELGVEVVAVTELYIEPPADLNSEPFGPGDDGADEELEVFELLLKVRRAADFALVFSGEDLVGIGRKVAGKLVVRATKAALRWMGRRAAEFGKAKIQWLKHRVAKKIARKLDERKGFRDLLRPMSLSDWSSPTPAGPVDWDHLAEGRTLMLIHGTGRACHKGFGQGSEAGLAGFKGLLDRYEGRVVGMDYRVLSQSPRSNVVGLLKQMAGQSLDLDIVAVSRGGLVARRLTERVGRKGIPGISKIKVHRLVFVGTPNAGTPLADEDNLMKVVESAMLFPKLLARLCQVWGLKVVVAAISIILKGAVTLASRFPGLAAQSTESELLAALNDSETFKTSASYYAVQCRLTGGGEFSQLAIDAFEDLAFEGRDCDLIVPTVTCGAPGVTGPKGTFPVTDGRLLEFNEPGVNHQSYFERSATWDHVLASLS